MICPLMHLFCLFLYNFQPVWMGYGVKDKHPTIIHHYAFKEEENKRVVYPLFAAGFLMSVQLLKRLV